MKLYWCLINELGKYTNSRLVYFVFVEYTPLPSTYLILVDNGICYGKRERKTKRALVKWLLKKKRK